MFSLHLFNTCTSLIHFRPWLFQSNFFEMKMASLSYSILLYIFWILLWLILMLEILNLTGIPINLSINSSRTGREFLKWLGVVKSSWYSSLVKSFNWTRKYSMSINNRCWNYSKKPWCPKSLNGITTFRK